VNSLVAQTKRNSQKQKGSFDLASQQPINNNKRCSFVHGQIGELVNFFLEPNL
jgi:hypothetical protein